LNALNGTSMPIQRTFKLDPPDPDVVRAANGAGAPPSARPAPKAKGVEVELRGVLDGPDSAPIFSLIFRESGGKERKEQFKLGDKILGEWTISEFSPAHNTMTVTNGDRLLILERGKAETLD